MGGSGKSVPLGCMGMDVAIRGVSSVRGAPGRGDSVTEGCDLGMMETDQEFRLSLIRAERSKKHFLLVAQQ